MRASDHVQNAIVVPLFLYIIYSYHLNSKNEPSVLPLPIYNNKTTFYSWKLRESFEKIIYIT